MLKSGSIQLLLFELFILGKKPLLDKRLLSD